MVTLVIIALTALVSYHAFSRPSIVARYSFSSVKVWHGKEYQRLLSHIFLHAGWEHLIFNMITLYFFGRHVEAVFSEWFGTSGTLLYVFFYIAAGVFASLYSLYKHRDNPNYYAIGASGAVSAVLFASILFMPSSKIYLFFIPIGIPAYIFGPLYLAYSAYMSKKGSDNIGHDAHFWGAVFGFVFPLLLDSRFLSLFLSNF
jgi:membrane associated rhomboid family serine protease